MTGETEHIFGLDEVRAARPEDRVVFVSGNFNVVHPGHLRLLKFAAEAGDYLVVGLHPDTNPGVTVPAEMRLEGLLANSHIDHAFLMSEPVDGVVRRLKPDIVVKGKEFEGQDNVEQAAVDEYGGRIVFGSGEVRFSSLRLLNQEYFQTTFSTITKPRDFPERWNFDVAGLKRVLKQFAGMRMLVVGDLIIDSYVDCEPLGMSQEEPTIVVTPLTENTFVGGAGIVALHARGLGADVSFVTVVGNDRRTTFAEERLASHGVNATLVVDETRPTTLKKRYRARGKSLLRLNELRQHPIEPDVARQVLAAVERKLPEIDLLLFSDFNYGCLPQNLVDAVVTLASARGIMMAADSQASSQLADISRFKGMGLVTPTEREARLAVQDFDSGLAVIAEKLIEASRAEQLVITLAGEGLLILGLGGSEVLRTDRLPAFNTSPKDVAGAGDSLFTCMSMALRSGADIWRSAYLGSIAAACQTSRVGNLPLTVADILTEIDYPDFRN